MVRKIALAVIAITALTFAGFGVSAEALVTPTPVATAAPCPSYNEYNQCIGSADGYPSGGFEPTVTPTPRPTPKPTSSAVVSADTVDATSGGSGNASIAFTGSESRVLGYVGAGMIGFGAIALAAARRRGEADTE